MSDVSVRRPRIFTIGHSNRTFDEFVKLLDHSSVRLVVDIRSNPASSRFPWFERHSLSSALQERGLAYRWFRVLGGRRSHQKGEKIHTALAEEGMRRYAAAMNTDDFHRACKELMGLAASTISVVMCAENEPERCHRLLLSDKLSVLGVRVVHIVDRDEARDHVQHPCLEIVNKNLIYEDKQLSLI